jgi:hypothetical protein
MSRAAPPDDRISRSVIFCSRITDRLPMFGIGANAKAGCHVFREKLESQVRYCQRMMAEPETAELLIFVVRHCPSAVAHPA